MQKMGDNMINVNWNDFQPHLIASQHDLFEDTHFADVTLVSDDEKQLKAHKVILSACSSFFRNMLISNPHVHPMIFMKGIKHKQLKALLQFMYCGEARIFDDQIDEFIAMAQDLKVKELSSKVALDTPDDIADNIEVVDPLSNSPVDEDQSEVLADSKLCKTSDESVLKRSVVHENQEKVLDSDEYYSKEHKTSLTSTEETPKTEITSVNGLFNCNLCHTVLSSRGCLKMHMQSIHEGIRYPCDQCDYKASKLGNLRRHKLVMHQDPKHFCDSCGFRTTAPEYLIKHKISRHTNTKYECNMCDYKATREDTVKHHVKVKHAQPSIE